MSSIPLPGQNKSLDFDCSAPIIVGRKEKIPEEY